MVFVTDNLAVFMVFLLAYILRFNFVLGSINFTMAVDQGMIVLIVYTFYSLIFHSYSGLLRHTTLTDISLVFIVTTISSVSLLFITLGTRTFGWNSILEIPMSIILIHYVSITVVLFFERV